MENGMKRLLTLEEIVRNVTIKDEIVEVPDLGGSIRIVEMTGPERDEYDSFLMDRADDEGNPKDIVGIRAKAVQICARDAAGKRIFESLDDVQRLPARIILALNEVASRLSGLSAEAKEQAKKN